MSVALRRVLLWGTLFALVAAALFVTLRPQPVPVDFVTVTRGPLQVAVEAEGETRIRDVYRVSAPVTGRLTRIKLEAGDTVEADRTLVAELQPIDPGCATCARRRSCARRCRRRKRPLPWPKPILTAPVPN